MSGIPKSRSEATPPDEPTQTKASVAPLVLSFERGVAPAKWARRWAESMPDMPLELIPRERVHDNRDADVRLERVAPGERPDDTARRAIHLYEEAVALVVAADHELAQASMIDIAELALVTLLEYPGHSQMWPAPVVWEDPSWRPRNDRAALDLVTAGTGTILMPLPLARHLTRRSDHAVLSITGTPALTGSTIWASWEVDRDAPDIQQLVGILRGRTARSSRAPQEIIDGTTGEGHDSKTRRTASGQRSKTPSRKSASSGQPKPGSRGAQLAAARQKAERHAAEKRAAKKRKRR